MPKNVHCYCIQAESCVYTVHKHSKATTIIVNSIHSWKTNTPQAHIYKA